MLEQQNHSCYICKEPETVTSRILSVDHDHETNKVRGLLCTNCNTALGKFKDNISFLKRAVEYLQRQYDVPRVEETVYFIPHVDRPNWRRIVHTPDGVFTSNEAASKHFNVHEATMLAWCGLNKKKTHLKKEGFVSEKLYISLKEAKEKFNVKD
jgi:ribosomal protein S8